MRCGSGLPRLGDFQQLREQKGIQIPELVAMARDIFCDRFKSIPKGELDKALTDFFVAHVSSLLLAASNC
jgi:hypothetical protein